MTDKPIPTGHVSDERLVEMLDSYEWLSSNPAHSMRMPMLADALSETDAQHAAIIRELQHCRSRYCPECEGVGWIRNPDARYEMEYVDGHLATGVYSTIDPEEIDCPRCNGVGFVKPRRFEPAPLAQLERDDGMPF